MRHGRKTRSQRIDGYKRHVLTDLDTDLVCAVGVTAANLAEAAVADQITADLDAQHATLGELHIDRAYLSSSLVTDRDPTWRCSARRSPPQRTTVRQARVCARLRPGHPDLPQQRHHGLHPRRQGPVPRPGLPVVPAPHPVHHQHPWPQRADPPRRAPAGRAPRRPADPHGRARLRQRTAVEHTLAHVGRWQGRRARYLGERKNLFDLRRVALVHNLHVIARQPSPAQQAA
jgi:hypothetical protein